MIDVGETAVCSLEIYSAGVLADPATSVTITITDPAGTVKVTASAMTNDSVGKYHYDYQTTGLTVLGKYKVLYIATDGSRITYSYDCFELG